MTNKAASYLQNSFHPSLTAAALCPAEQGGQGLGLGESARQRLRHPLQHRPPEGGPRQAVQARWVAGEQVCASPGQTWTSDSGSNGGCSSSSCSSRNINISHPISKFISLSLIDFY